MDSPKPKRRWTRLLVPRYSLRALLILVTVISVVLGYHVNEVRKQKEVVAWVKEQGGSVWYEYYVVNVSTPVEYDYGWEPDFLRDLLGDDFFYDVTFVNLAGHEVSDLSPLASLTNLKWLDLEGTAVSDLSSLASLTNLSDIELEGTAVSDLSPLASLTNLEWLGLNRTAVSDLSPLASLTNLVFLELEGTKVAKEEIAKLQAVLPNCNIEHDFDLSR